MAFAVEAESVADIERRAYGRAELPSVVNHDGESPGNDAHRTPRGRLKLVSASRLEAQPVDWMWPGRIPFGAITLLAGDPGLGKSLLTCSLAALASRGQLGGERVRTLMSSAEDSLERTIKPRLEAVGADMEQIQFVSIHEDGLERHVDLPKEIETVKEAVDEVDAGLLIIDLLTAHFSGGVNANYDQSVRTALAPLHRLAEERGIAVVVVVHLNKGQLGGTLHRIGGSLGLPAAARSVLMLARDPDDEDGEAGSYRVLAHAKNNLGEQQPSLRYVVEAAEAGEGIQTARIVEVGESRYTAYELLTAEPVNGSALEHAEQFLLDILKDGPVATVSVEERAKAEQISERTLRRARQCLGVIPDKDRFEGGWSLRLPDSQPADPADVDLDEADEDDSLEGLPF